MRSVLLGLLLVLLVTSPVAAQGRPTDAEGDDAYATRTVHSVATGHFRVHWTSTTEDAASIAFVKTTAATLEEVWDVVVDDLGWPAPPVDGDLGGDDLLDVYLVDLGDQTYGYATADDAALCGRCGPPHGYLVLDNDYVGFPPSASVALRSTAAHELGHLIQFGVAYDAEAWAYEATAVWLERVVFPGDDARTQYLRDFAAAPHLPLTDVGVASGGADRSYGAYVWDAWLADRHGAALVRDAWLAAGAADQHALGGYQTALRSRGALLEQELVAFHVATAAWDHGGFPGEPARYPPVARADALAGGDVVEVELDHTAAHLADVDVRDRPGAEVSVTVRGPKFVSGGVGLVATSADGSVVSTVDDTLFDGRADVALQVPAGTVRVTLVVVNADATLAAPKEAGSDRARYLNDGIRYRIGVGSDPGAPAKR